MRVFVAAQLINEGKPDHLFAWKDSIKEDKRINVKSNK